MHRRNVKARIIRAIRSREGDCSIWYAVPVSSDLDLETRWVVFSSTDVGSNLEIDQLYAR